jgi:hypothetical protein
MLHVISHTRPDTTKDESEKKKWRLSSAGTAISKNILNEIALGPF